MTTFTTKPLLAFDTSTPTARVALISPSGDCLVQHEKTAARHSANLLGLIDETLREAGVVVAELAAIACGAGPGSFTGLRVGFAVAKGLALPTAVPLVLVSSLDALACDLAEDSRQVSLLLPCLDAGKGQVYARLYPPRPPRPAQRGEVAERSEAGEGLGGRESDAGERSEAGEGLNDSAPDWVLSPGDLCRLAVETAAGRRLLAGGTGVDRYLDVLRAGLGEGAVRPSVPGPSAMAVARLAWERISRGESDDIETAVPRYGRPPDITRPKKPMPGI